MKLKNALKKGSLVATIGLGLTFFSPVTSDFAHAAEFDPKAASQQLVDSLKALNLDNVDYLYAYLQSVNLTETEYKKITENTNRVNQLLDGKSVGHLSNAQKVEMGKLFIESVKLAHLDVMITDANGNKISITDYRPGLIADGLLLQFKDLKGNLLASITPTVADFAPAAIAAKLASFKAGIDAKIELDESGEFVPMPSATLPNTSTELPSYIALGGLLVVLGGLALIPATRLVRKSEQTAGI